MIKVRQEDGRAELEDETRDTRETDEHARARVEDFIHLIVAHVPIDAKKRRGAPGDPYAGVSPGRDTLGGSTAAAQAG